MYFQLRDKTEDIAQIKTTSPWRERMSVKIIFSSMMIPPSPKCTDYNTRQINVQKHLDNMKTELSCQVDSLSWNTSLIFLVSILEPLKIRFKIIYIYI